MTASAWDFHERLEEMWTRRKMAQDAVQCGQNALDHLRMRNSGVSGASVCQLAEEKSVLGLE